MKLAKKVNSKRTTEMCDRAYCHMLGIKYPITHARAYKAAAVKNEIEYLLTGRV